MDLSSSISILEIKITANLRKNGKETFSMLNTSRKGETNEHKVTTPDSANSLAT